MTRTESDQKLWNSSSYRKIKNPVSDKILNLKDFGKLRNKPIKDENKMWIDSKRSCYAQ